jgi:hypothetical protein
VPLNDDALAALREAYKARQSIWVIERGAQQVKSIKKAFQAASAPLGNPRHSVHASPYRRGLGGRGGRQHGRARAIHGHDDSSTTEKQYARFSPGHLRKVANAVQRRPQSGQEVQL